LYNSLNIVYEFMRVYAQSVARIHGHSGLDAMPLADSAIKDRLIKLRLFID